MFSKTFCILPWIQLVVKNNGFIRLCCISPNSYESPTYMNMLNKENRKYKYEVKEPDGVSGYLGDSSISDVWNNKYMKSVRRMFLNNQIPTHCVKCFDSEYIGSESKRESEFRRWTNLLGEKEIEKIVSNTRQDGHLPLKLYYTNLRFGNKCNLACMGCSKNSSSTWEKIPVSFKKIYSNTSQKKFVSKEIGSMNWFKNKKFASEFDEQLHNIHSIYLSGGETLIIKEYEELVKKIIKIGRDKDVTIRYASNGIFLEEKHFEMWKNFKQIKFLFSLDAVGDKNEYIRWPSRWNIIKKKLKMIDSMGGDNITPFNCCVVQATNIFYIPELIVWLHKQNYKKINPWRDIGEIPAFNIAITPLCINIRILPVKFKKRITKKYKKFYKWLEKNTESEDVLKIRIRKLEELLNYMNSCDWSDKFFMFKNYIAELDRVRSTNFRETFPELQELLDEY